MTTFQVAGRVLSVLLAFVSITSADPIRLDQSVTGISPTGAVIGESWPFVTQTFTAGLTGRLVAISVDIEALTPTPLRLAITPASGLPDLSHVLAEIFVPSGSSPLSRLIMLGAPVDQRIGQSYAIVASYPSASPSPFPFSWTGGWSGTGTDSYAGGAPYSLQRNGTWVLQGTDLRFATFVENPVPEPGSLLLLATGIAGLVLRRRQCRRAEPTC